MKKLNLKLALLSLSVAVLTGCVNKARPTFHNGNYYMAGDDNCRIVEQRTFNTLNCYNKDQVFTGARPAMTNQQLRRLDEERKRRSEANDRMVETISKMRF